MAFFTIFIGVMVALFSFLAFAVQRARYLKEIEPDLRPSDKPEYESVSFTSLEDPNIDFPAFLVRWPVKNTSTNIAKDVSVSWELQIAKQVLSFSSSFGSSEFETIQTVREVELAYPYLLPGRSNVLIANFVVPLDDPIITAIVQSPLEVTASNIAVRVKISLKYFNQRDFVSTLFKPWSEGLVEYGRTAEMTLGFQDNELASKPRYLVNPVGIRVL